VGCSGRTVANGRPRSWRDPHSDVGRAIDELAPFPPIRAVIAPRCSDRTRPIRRRVVRCPSELRSSFNIGGLSFALVQRERRAVCDSGQLQTVRHILTILIGRKRMLKSRMARAHPLRAPFKVSQPSRFGLLRRCHTTCTGRRPWSHASFFYAWRRPSHESFQEDLFRGVPVGRVRGPIEAGSHSLTSAPRSNGACLSLIPVS
jgi:hypothetical protein